MREILIPNKNAVTPGTQFSIRPIIGPTYESIRLYLKGGLTAAHIKNLRVEVRGQAIWDLNSATELQVLNKFYKRPMSDEDDVVVLWFYRPELEDIAQRHTFSLGTADVDTLAITMDIADNAPAESGITVKCRQGDAAGLGMITKLKKFPQTFAQGGEQFIADIPLMDAAICGMHLGPHTDGVQKVQRLRLELDGIKQVEGSRREIHDSALETIAPVNAWTHVPFIGQGDMREALATESVQDFRLTLTLASPAAFPLIVEYFDTFRGA